MWTYTIATGFMLLSAIFEAEWLISMALSFGTAETMVIRCHKVKAR